MRIDVISLFPGLFAPFLETGIFGRARQRGLVHVSVHDLREDGEGAHRKVDDTPYGGGGGMVLSPGPLFAALDRVRAEELTPGPVVLLSPQGRRLDHEVCQELAQLPRLILVCGRYEGLDERFVEAAVDREISIGDYVLSGGEVPAMLLIEGMVRLVPGVLGNPKSASEESFQEDLLEAPHYTRPAEFRGHPVPEVLRSGNHAAIEQWRREQSREITLKRRPDLLGSAQREEER